MERFIGVLIENYAGNFPVWLAPVQVQVIPVSENSNDYAEEVYATLKADKIRAEIDLKGEKIGYKIREAESMKIPYMLIVGDKEKENRTVSVRKHKEGDIGVMALNEFMEKVNLEISKKSA